MKYCVGIMMAIVCSGYAIANDPWGTTYGNHIIIGENTYTGLGNSDLSAIFIGNGAGGAGGAVLIGSKSSSFFNGVAIGMGSTGYWDSIALGNRASAYCSSMSLGHETQAEGWGCLSIGPYAYTGSYIDDSIALGAYASATASYGIAIGGDSSVDSSSSVAIGYGATVPSQSRGVQLLGGALEPNTLLQVKNYRFLDENGKILPDRVPGQFATVTQMSTFVDNSIASLSSEMEETYVKKADPMPRGFVYEEVVHSADVAAIALKHGCIHVIPGGGTQRITLSIDDADVPAGSTFDALLMVEAGDVQPQIVYPQGCIYGFGVKPRLDMKGVWYLGFGKVGGKIRVGASGPFMEVLGGDDD